MRKVVLLCGALLGLSLSLMAQDLPRFDVFAGYSYIHFSIQDGSSGNITSNLNGGNGAVAFYPGKSLGIVADFGGYKISTLKQGSTSLDVSGTTISYLFGPRFRFGGGAVTPFVQVLFGGAHNGDITTNVAAACGGTPPCTIIKSENAFAMTAGGGVDIKVARHFSIRGQAEYLMTRFKQGGGGGTGMGTTGTQSNVRISTGIVLH